MQSANIPVFRATALPPLSRIISAAASSVGAWDARIRSRKGLGRLDAHLLRDIGLDAMTAQEHATLPFWHR